MARRMRLTCAGWWRTPNSRAISSATRRVVHTSPTNPYASAPHVNNSGKRARWSAVSCGCLPGGGRRRSASRPPCRARASHWLTAPRVTPNASAIRIAFQPCSYSSSARRRRPSCQSCGGPSVVVFIPHGVPHPALLVYAPPQRSVNAGPSVLRCRQWNESDGGDGHAARLARGAPAAGVGAQAARLEAAGDRGGPGDHARGGQPAAQARAGRGHRGAAHPGRGRG